MRIDRREKVSPLSGPCPVIKLSAPSPSGFTLADFMNSATACLNADMFCVNLERTKAQEKLFATGI